MDPTLYDQVELLLTGRDIPTTPQEVVSIMREERGIDVETIAIPRQNASSLTRFEDPQMEGARQRDHLQTQLDASDVHVQNRNREMYVGAYHNTYGHPRWWSSFSLRDLLNGIENAVNNLYSDLGPTIPSPAACTREHIAPFVIREYHSLILPPTFADDTEARVSVDVIAPDPDSSRAIQGTTAPRITALGHSRYGRDLGYHAYMLPRTNDAHGELSMRLNVEQYNQYVAPYIEQLTQQGYEIVSREVQMHSAPRDRVEIPMWAVPGEGSPLRGKHAVLLFNFGSEAVIAYIMEDVFFSIAQQIPEPEIEEPEISDDDRMLTLLLLQVSGAAVTLNENVSSLQSSVERNERELQDLHSSIASYTRRITDDQRQLTLIQTGLRDVAMTSVRDMHALPELVASMRPVERCEVVAEPGNVAVSLVTHPFGMHYDGTGYLIPQHRININTLTASFDNGVRITPVTGDRCRHPHVTTDGRICWGQAGIPLADAWGRRDWESLIRIILGWYTRYNPNSPYQRLETDLYDVLTHTEERGWITSNTAVSEETVEA